jgi:hypothetical protein
MEVEFDHKGLLKQNYMKSRTRERRRQEEDGEQEENEKERPPRTT